MSAWVESHMVGMLRMPRLRFPMKQANALLQLVGQLLQTAVHTSCVRMAQELDHLMTALKIFSSMKNHLNVSINQKSTVARMVLSQ